MDHTRIESPRCTPMKKQFPSCILAEIEQQCCLLLAKLLPSPSSPAWGVALESWSKATVFWSVKSVGILLTKMVLF